MFGVGDLQEVNKLLFAVAELSVRRGTAASHRVSFLCRSVVFAGRKHNHKRLVELGASLGLLARADSNLALTPKGKYYLSLNPDQTYELTQAQKDYWLEHLIFEGLLKSHSVVLFRLFQRDYGRDTWVLDTVDRPIPTSLTWLTSLLMGLGATQRDHQLLTVISKYKALVTQFMTEKHGPSPDELAAIQGTKRELGELGEMLVEKFERERLLSLGRQAEADLVRRISVIDTAAGYDVQSFDGNQPAYDYDRFIEVKASTDMRLRFYWSRNEYETAVDLGDKYWIYLCSELDPRDPQHAHLILIQNPIAKLDKLGFSIEPSEYIISHGGTLNMGLELHLNNQPAALVL